MSNSRSSSNYNNDVDSDNSNLNKNLNRPVTKLNYRPIELTQRVKRIESDDNHYLSSKYKSNLPSLINKFNNDSDMDNNDYSSNPKDYDWALFMSAYAQGRWDPFEIPRPPSKLNNDNQLSLDTRRTCSTHSSFDLNQQQNFSQIKRRLSLSEFDKSKVLPSPSIYLGFNQASPHSDIMTSTSKSAPMSNIASDQSFSNNNDYNQSIYPLNLSTNNQNLNFNSDLAVQVATHSLIHPDQLNKSRPSSIASEDSNRPSSAPENSNLRQSNITLPSRPYNELSNNSFGYFDFKPEFNQLPQHQQQNESLSPSISKFIKDNRTSSFDSNGSDSVDTVTPIDFRPSGLTRGDSDVTVTNEPKNDQIENEVDSISYKLDKQDLLSLNSQHNTSRSLPIEMKTISDSIPSRLSSEKIQQLAEKQFNELNYLVPPLPVNEDVRRKELYKFDLMRQTPELSLDRILHLVKLVFQTKCVIISLVNGDNVILKAHTGFEEIFERRVTDIEPRTTALSSHAILQQNDEPLVSLDISRDWRFARNPSFGPKVRFYAAAPIRTYNGYNIGALSLIDSTPRSEFTPRQRHTLKEFAAIVLREMELWRDKCQMRTRDLIQSSMEQFNRDILEMNSAGQSRSSNSDMQKVYEKAARLIKDTLGVEGALVLDISQFEVAENLGDENDTQFYMPDPITQSSHCEGSSRNNSTTNLSSISNKSKNTQRPISLSKDSNDTYGRNIPILAAFEDGSPPRNRNQPVSQENAEKLAWFLKRNPDGYIFDYGLIPGLFKQFVGQKDMYGMAIVPIFNLSNDKDGPFALLVAYTADRKLLLEGYEIQYLRAMGVIILSAVLKERILLADKAKQNFISNISHELRTPLHGILAAAELLQDTELDEVQVEFLDTVKACGRSLSETLNHVLDFTKLSGSSTSAGVERGIKLSKVNLKNLVEEAVESTIIGYRGKFAASNEGLGDIYAPPSTSPSLTSQKVDHISKTSQVETLIDIQWRSNWFCRCEKAGLRRVLQNLVGNAQKFTKRGYILVTVREAPHSPGSKKVPIELSVIDTGKGMSKNFLDSQVFQPFSQEDPLQAGTGLGLAIVSSIIKSPSVNGQIDIRSREDVGTEIKMTIPVETIDDPQQSSSNDQMFNHESIIEKLGYSSSWRPKLSLHGFDTSTLGGQALYNVTSNYLQDWLGLDCIESTKYNHYLGDILVINELNEVFLELIEEKDSRKPVLIISSSRADKRLYNTKVDYEKLGGIARIIYKPAGPSKFDMVLEVLINALAQTLGFHKVEKQRNNLPLPSPATSSTSNQSDYFSDQHSSQYSDRRNSNTSNNAKYRDWKNQMQELLSPTKDIEKTFPKSSSSNNDVNIQRRNSDKSTSQPPSRPGLPSRSVTYHHSSNYISQSHGRSTSGTWSNVNLSGSGNNSSPSTPGSTISIAGSGAILRSSTENEPVKAHGQPFRVLCVDDNAINLNLLTKFLKKKGCEYVEATDGSQAVDIIKATELGHFAVILMDVSMPVMDGLEATIEIRKIESERRKHVKEKMELKQKQNSNSYLSFKDDKEPMPPPAKIFALTGLAAKEDRKRAFNSGVDGYLIKPASFKSLDLLLSRIGVSHKAPAPTPPIN